MSVSKEERMAAIVEMRKQADERRKAFKAELERENGTQDNPKRDILFQKAWEFGHAYGENDVRIYYEDLIDLVR